VSATGWVFWAGTVGFGTPVLERLAAAATVDVQRFSITPIDVEAVAAEGMPATELGRRIRDAGYDVVMDPVVNWYGGAPHPGSRFGRFSTDDTLRMSAETGAIAMNLIGQPAHDATLDELATAFAAVCDRAAGIGAQAHLEFTPITAIVDLAAGWDIVRTAGRANGGLLFDTWHFFRGNPDLDLLARIPGDRIFSVQVADARAERLPDVRLDTQHRLLPGDGVLDITGALRVLDRIGALAWVGPEVIAPELAAMPTADAAQLADARVRTAVDAARRPA
jgi:sugar phosphate isomerase/epimerase